MRLIIDHREKKIYSLVQGIFPGVERATLPVGDLIVMMNDYVVLVERKSVPDLVSSIRSSRLWEQLVNMLRTQTVWGYDIRRRILVIHGDLATYLSTSDAWPTSDQWRFWSSLAGAMQEILFVYGTPIVFAENDDLFSQFLRILMKREEEGANDGLPKARWYPQCAPRGLPPKESRVLLLDMIPGVGDILGRNLLESFGTIERIATASPQELQVVDGIGKKKAQQIYQIFHT